MLVVVRYGETVLFPDNPEVGQLSGDILADLGGCLDYHGTETDRIINKQLCSRVPVEDRVLHPVARSRDVETLPVPREPVGAQVRAPVAADPGDDDVTRLSQERLDLLGGCHCPTLPARLDLSAHTVTVAHGAGEWPPGDPRRILWEQSGLDLVELTPTDGGESRNVFWATDRAGTVSVLKVMPDTTPDAADHLRALGTVLDRLRDRGYPAPRFRAVGHVPGLVFWVQQRLPGSPAESESESGSGEPDRAALARLLPALLRLNDAQAGLGTGPRQWPGLITRTLTTGGDGYCLHATLQANPGTRDLLRVLRRIGDRCCADIPDASDFVHYDFAPANLLIDGTSITGVIDINPPVLAGDRAFDLATLLFYLYDHSDTRDLLRARLFDLAGPRVACAYLAHMVLRQVDWSLRYHPEAIATQRHLRLAAIVTADIDRDSAR